MQQKSVLKSLFLLFVLPFCFIALLWIILFIEGLFGISFAEYGILPRTITGLRGIVFSPFLHGDLNHLYSNSITLFILLVLLNLFYKEQSLKVVVLGILISGFLTWIIGKSAYHIGASGLIYVLASFIFFRGIFTKRFLLMLLSVIIFLVYGGMIWYALPTVPNGISWEGHLSGLIAGYILAQYVIMDRVTSRYRTKKAL